MAHLHKGALRLVHSVTPRDALIARFDQRRDTGVVLYDSHTHGPEHLATLPSALQEQVRAIRAQNPKGRITIRKTTAMPGDAAEEGRNHRLHVVR